MAKFTISACQYVMHPISSFDDFAKQVRNLLDQTGKTDLIVFPELLTLQLFTVFPDWQNKPMEEFYKISEFTDQYKELFEKEAIKRQVPIAAGSHLMKVDGEFLNVGHLFFPDGSCKTHAKTHIFPAEKVWNTSEGNEMQIIEIPPVTTGFNICYETEIPECSASLTEQGANLIISPSATFSEEGFWRVRHCAQSRCIENQIYYVHCCLGGDVGAPVPTCYAKSSILSPCDSGFPNAAGILAEAEPNKEMVITATIDLDVLAENRKSGAATTYNDRRRRVDLYKKWNMHF